MHEDRDDRGVGSGLGDVGDTGLECLALFGFTAQSFQEQNKDPTLFERFGDRGQAVPTAEEHREASEGKRRAECVAPA